MSPRKKLLIARSGAANAHQFSHVRARLDPSVLEGMVGRGHAIQASANTASYFFLDPQSGGNSVTGGPWSPDLVIESAKNSAVAAARELFPDRFVGARVEMDPEVGYTIWVEVKQPTDVAEEVAMEDTFYGRLANGSDRRVNALLDFRSA